MKVIFTLEAHLSSLVINVEIDKEMDDLLSSVDVS